MKTTAHTLIAFSVRTTACLLLLHVTARAGAVLNPASFTSLGANPFAAAGNYTVNTSGATPVLTLPNATTINGVVSGGIAVFTFSNLTIGTGVTIKGFGTLPLALLSQDFFNITGGTIDVSGSDGQANNGPTGGAGGAGGPGGFAGGKGGTGSLAAPFATDGGGPGGGTSGTTGGGFGGTGGKAFAGVAGGNSYGDLTVKLEGGSGGGGGLGAPIFSFGSGGGGGGGGAIELGAVTTLTIGGEVLANGGTGVNAGANGGGSGSGGGILIHAHDVTLTGSLKANGGVGVTDGDGGGGGRIAILTASGTLTGNGTTSVAGGLHGPNATLDPIGNGQPGVITVGQIPEPSTWVLLALAIAVLPGVSRHRA